jgi:hypothetical protein
VLPFERIAAMSEPTRKSYHLSLGRGDRSITDQGEGVETVDPYIVARPGTRRSIVFHSCKLRGDIEIDGRKVSETSVTAYIQERSPDRPPWPDEPWKIGTLDWQHASVSLDVSPVAFQQLWEMADARENERLDMDIRGQVSPHGVLFVFENRLKLARSSGSSEHSDELRRLREIAAYTCILLGYIAIGLVYWQGGFYAAVVACGVLWLPQREVLDVAYPRRVPERLERQARRRKASQRRAGKRAARREAWNKQHPVLEPLWSRLRVILIVGGLVVGAALVFGLGTTVANRYGTAILAAAHDPKPIFDAIVWWQWIAIYLIASIGWFAAKVGWESWGTPTDEA